MSLNTYRDKTGEINKANGFHTVPFNLGEKLMLVTTELAECLEAHRVGKHSNMDEAEARYQQLRDSANTTLIPLGGDEWTQVEIDAFKSSFKSHVKEGVEAEIGDAMIRLFDIAYLMNIDLDRLIPMILRNNSLRSYMHGKKY